jgi:hypothetical protein
MLGPSFVREAARNNAEWCNVFCRTHGLAGRFSAGFWSSGLRTPRLYPDAVTLVPNVDVERMLGIIDVSEGCSVKDSFADVDLSAVGFRTLFHAEWLLRQWDRASAPADGTWAAITTTEQLREWESGWAESPDATNFFRPALLADEAIAVLARHQEGQIVAGAIANRSSKVIGLSNIFAADEDLESAWLGAAAAANARWGRQAVVSYDSGVSLEGAHRAGFDSIGELRVWLYASSSP